MNCLHCNAPYEDGFKFCKNCGKKMGFPPLSENSKISPADLMLLIFSIVTALLTLIQFTIEKLVDNLYMSPVAYFQGALWIFNNICFILIPLSIKNQTLKIIGLVVTTLLIIYWVVNNVIWMINLV